MSRFSHFSDFANWNRTSRKRSLGFQEDGVQSISSTTPTKACIKRNKLDTCHSASKGWGSWKHGFEGVSVTDDTNPHPKRRCKLLNTAPASQVVGQTVKELKSKETSQAEIIWDSSDNDEDSLSDGEAVDGGQAANVRPETQHPASVSHDVDAENTPDPSIDVPSSPEQDGGPPDHEDQKVVDELGSISDYCSDDELSASTAGVPGLKDNQSQHMASNSPSISSVPTQSPIEDMLANADDESVKCSQWVKSLQSNMKTPEKNRCKQMVKTPDDSAKKRKQKFISSGMAERLKRLITRQKSDIAFWNHKASSQDSQDSLVMLESTKRICVKIEHVTLQGRLCLTRCSVTESMQADYCGQNVYIILPKSTYQHLNLRDGTHLEIHPPWKEFLTASSQRVLLCTHYLKEIAQEHSSHQDNPQVSESCATDCGNGMQTMATWQCPCVQDRSLPHQRCSAYNNQDYQLSDSQVFGQLERLTGMDGSHEFRLQSVQDDEYSHSMLESIERRGGFFADGVSFVAQVVQVFCRRQYDCSLPSSSSLVSRRTQVANANEGGVNIRWFALLRDQSGSFCELSVLPEAVCQREWNAMIRDTEGHCYKFTDLKVQGKTTRVKNPSLFTCIDSFLHNNEKEFSASPGFCYELTMKAEQSTCLPRSSNECGGYAMHRPCQLEQIVKKRALRSSCFCKLLWSNSQNTSNSYVWFITDISLNEEGGQIKHGYVTVTVRDSCYVDQSILSSIRTESQGLIILFIQNMVFSKELGFQVDAYSRVYRVRTSDVTDCLHTVKIDSQLYQDLKIFKPRFPQLRETSGPYSLVTVSGCIVDVDQSTAYSWPECNFCHSIKLEEIHTNGSLTAYHCQDCDRDVHSAITRIRLDVFLNSLPGSGSVKVKLCQQTITNILPEENSDEGYELDAVLGKTVGPLDCIISSIADEQNKTLFSLRELNLS